MEEKRKAEVCEGEKDEKGTKWRGREPMNPNLIKEPRQASLNMHVLCVHLRWRRVPTDPGDASTAVVTLCLAEMAGCFDRCGHVKA